jgi:preprotein translocase subunit SecG
MNFVYYLLISLMVFVAVLLILVILIQKGRGGGLSGAFGGGGGSSAFGAKTGDVLTWATSIIFGVFLLLGVSLDLVVNHMYPSTVQTSSTPATPVHSTPATETPAPTPTPAINTGPVAPPINLPTTQQVTNAANQLIQTGKSTAGGILNSATQQAAPLVNPK